LTPASLLKIGLYLSSKKLPPLARRICRIDRSAPPPCRRTRCRTGRAACR
jgi:hypothetical protein